jgi:hypothetical protein
MNGVDGGGNRQLKRVLIQNLLAERFGSHLINDAEFQQTVDRVTETVEDEAAASALISRVVRALRASARKVQLSVDGLPTRRRDRAVANLRRPTRGLLFSVSGLGGSFGVASFARPNPEALATSDRALA